MANKTTVNTKPQDQTAKAAIQLQLARIKKEEEEELWISGEELYTEGSSDEEECKTQMRSRRRANNNHSSRASSANPCDDRRGRSPVYNQVRAKSENPSDLDNTIGEGRFKSENMPKISPLSVKSSSSSTTESERAHRSSKNEVKESNVVNSISEDLIDVGNFSMDKTKVESTEISWKANRGTFVLPNSSNNMTENVDKC